MYSCMDNGSTGVYSTWYWPFFLDAEVYGVEGLIPTTTKFGANTKCWRQEICLAPNKSFAAKIVLAPNNVLAPKQILAPNEFLAPKTCSAQKKS